MKTILVALIVLSGTLTPANAGYRRDCHRTCEIYLVNTCEVHRCSVKKMGYDRCGNCYWYRVVTVTYRDYYSDGSSCTRSRSFRA